VISSFDGAYSAYNGFQSGIERYWALRWIEQQGLTELDASVMKDGLGRLEGGHDARSRQWTEILCASRMFLPC